VSAERRERVEARGARIARETDRLRARRREGVTLFQLLSRPGSTYAALLVDDPEAIADEALVRQIEVTVKYEGYIRRMRHDVARFKANEAMTIPETVDYATIPGLSSEVRQRLAGVRPRSLGQAARVPGVTPAAIAILSVWCRRA
jgi:tRNA uridine 5-carboxymethylaminomethyl modification enzyme